MTKRKVWRYKCDFCRRSNCSGGSISSHEVRCFRNPARKCSMCDAQWPLPALSAPLAALAEIEKKTEQELLAAVSKAVEGCPACVCAAINQAELPIQTHTSVEFDGIETDTEYRYHVDFNYKKERDIYMADKRQCELDELADYHRSF